jgi:hypothetical protein
MGAARAFPDIQWVYSCSDPHGGERASSRCRLTSSATLDEPILVQLERRMGDGRARTACPRDGSPQRWVT